MRNIGLLQHSLKLLLPLTLVACDGFRKSSCDVDSPAESCLRPQIVSAAADFPLDGSPVTVKFENLEHAGSLEHVSVELSLHGSDGTARPHTALSTKPNSELCNPSSCEVDLAYLGSPELKGLSGGPVTLRVCSIAGTRCSEFSMRAYVPPSFSEPALVPAPLIKPNPPNLMIAALPGSNTPATRGLFVTTTDSSLQRILTKYNYDGDNKAMVEDSDFVPLKAPAVARQYLGLFAISQQSIIALQFKVESYIAYYLTPYQLSDRKMGSALPLIGRMPGRPNPTILSADPTSSTVMMVDDKQIDAFNFGYGTSYQPIASLATATALRYFTALKAPRSPADLGDKTTLFDAVGVDASSTLFVYRLTANSLSVDSVLSKLVNDQLPKDRTVAGLAISDLDRDGSPDLVFALANNKVTQEIAWLRYLGDGKFAPLQLIPLRGTPMQEVVTMAVGDLNEDGRADVALGTSESIQVYLNTSN